MWEYQRVTVYAYTNTIIAIILVMENNGFKEEGGKIRREN